MNQYANFGNLVFHRKQNSDPKAFITLIYVKAQDLKHPDIMFSSKKFKATKSLGFCHACYDTYQNAHHDTSDNQKMRNYKSHTNSGHAAVVIKECAQCHQTFDRGIRYRNHLCTKIRRTARNFTKYHLRPLNSVLEVLSRQNGTVPNPLGPIDNNEPDSAVAPPLSNLQMHTICHSGKANLFGGLHIFLEGGGDLTLFHFFFDVCRKDCCRKLLSSHF